MDYWTLAELRYRLRQLRAPSASSHRSICSRPSYATIARSDSSTGLYDGGR
jgi:hypothetical protein